MLGFTYYTPTKVEFGKGAVEKVGALMKQFGGTRVLIHYGGQSAVRSGVLDRVKKSLDEAGIFHVELGGVVPNPHLAKVREGIELSKANGVDFLLAVGGGSVIDSCKAIAYGLAEPEHDVWELYAGQRKAKACFPVASVLTIAAAGSEMSNSCVITNTDTDEKRAYDDDLARPKFAIMDPELTMTLPDYQTEACCAYIMMHTMERYFVNSGTMELTDALAEGLLRTVMHNAEVLHTDPHNYDARAEVMWASSLAHNGLTQCGRTFQMAVHQLEHEVSGMYPKIAHGAGLAALWCSWARYVYRANISRWLQFAKNVWNLDIDFEHPEKTVEEAISLQEQYYASIGMPIGLKALGVREADLPKLALDCSRNHTRILAGYRQLDYPDMLTIYRMAYERG